MPATVLDEALAGVDTHGAFAVFVCATRSATIKLAIGEPRPVTRS
jgi:hypothetical protein